MRKRNACSSCKSTLASKPVFSNLPPLLRKKKLRILSLVTKRSILPSRLVLAIAPAIPFPGCARSPHPTEASRNAPSPLFRNNWFGVGLYLPRCQQARFPPPSHSASSRPPPSTEFTPL